MSAKKNRNPVPASAASAPAPTPAASVITAPESWLDSADPRKRQLARVLLVGVWIYVGALWLLALDQTFDWSIF